jgi:chitin deacetylase
MRKIRRKKIKKQKQFIKRMRIAFIALIAMCAILVSNIITSEISHANRGMVVSATVTHKENAVNSDGLTAEAGIEEQGEALKLAIAQLKPKFEVPEAFQGKVIREAKTNTEDKFIALTFDDGPWPRTTSKVLEILKENDMKATFFLIGKHLKDNPEIAREIVADGHAIGNHTWSHQYHKFSPAEAAQEIDDTEALIYETTGVKTSYFRPPGGMLKNGLAAYAEQNSYAVMMWSVDSADSRGNGVPAATLVKNVLKNARPGGVVLLHDGGGDRSTTVQALPQIIEGLKQQGYKFVTVPQLLEMQKEAPPSQPVMPPEEHADKDTQTLPSQ